MGDDTPLIPADQGEKVGHKLFGCCCDSLRAVIIYSILGIIGAIANIITVLSITPEVEEELEEDGISVEASKTVILFLASMDLLVFIATAYGAKIYNLEAVWAGPFWTIIRAVVTIWFNINGAAIAIPTAIIGTIIPLYIYGVFIKEVKSGIMSPETYPREGFSCCCGP